MKFFTGLLTSSNMEKIESLLKELSLDELDEFGEYLYSTFFDVTQEEEYENRFEFDDILNMINILGEGFYETIIDLLNVEVEELDEGVKRVMVKTNMNRKKRKFMTNSKADMRKTKALRKREARASKTSRKRYYRANKKKIASYQKSRTNAIKKGKHSVKLRKTA